MKFLFFAIVFFTFTPYANSYIASNSFLRLNHDGSLELKGALYTHRCISALLRGEKFARAPRYLLNMEKLRGEKLQGEKFARAPRYHLNMEIDQLSTSKGGLKSLPRVFPAPELWARALKRSTYVKEDISIQNARIRCRKLAAERLSVLSKELTKPLGSFLDGYGSVLSRLPPFEKIVVDLTVRHRYSAA
jgi:hypothetical protein